MSTSETGTEADRPGEEAQGRESASSHDRPRRLLKRIGLGLVVLVAVVFLVKLVEVKLTSPALCASCHEIAPRYESWSRSVHANVTCVDCHIAPHEWHEAPETIAAVTLRLAEDTWLHVTRSYEDTTTSAARHHPVEERACLDCHTMSRTVTPTQGVLIDHREHAQRNRSCLSCHVDTGHPIESRGNSLSLMGRCFACHGDSPSAKAPATCTLCHPASYEPRPESHFSAKWNRQHARVALEDRPQCAMCHRADFCDECHGLPMPHPAEWSQRSGHVTAAEDDEHACRRCHAGGASMCTSCHHERFDARSGSWLEQHPRRAEDGGTRACLGCHSPLACASCHAKRHRDRP